MYNINNKGFAVSGVIYTILIICLTSMAILLGTFNNRKTILDTIKRETFESLNDSITNETIGKPIVVGGSTTLTNSKTFTIQEPVSSSGINYYQYYITDDIADVPSRIAKISGAVQENEVDISITGTYIYFRAISVLGTVGDWSDVSNLYVEADPPVLISFSEDGGIISFTATDETGIVGWNLTTTSGIPPVYLTVSSTLEYTHEINAPYDGTFYLHVVDSLGNRVVKKIDVAGVYLQVVDSNPGIICGTGASEDYAGNTVCDINSVEDFVEFSKMTRNGNTFENKTVNINYGLDFNLDRSYINPNTTVFGDINGDGSTTGLKDELSTDKGYSRTGNILGTVDGHNNYLKNVYFNRPDENFPSVFGWNSGTLKNIKFDNVNVTGASYGGIVVGYNLGTGRLENIKVKNSSITATGVQIGGVIGWADGSASGITIIDSTVNGNENVGGVLGYSPAGTFSSIFVDNVSVTGTTNMGGLVGNQGTSTITNALVRADVSGTTYKGGLIGVSNNGTVKGIFDSGTVDGKTIIGTYLNSPSITGYYVEGKVTGATDGYAVNASSLPESSYNDLSAYGVVLETIYTGDVDGDGYYFAYQSGTTDIYLRKL